MNRFIKTLVALSLSLILGAAQATLVFDAVSTTGGGTTSFTHTPVGTPGCVVVLVAGADAAITSGTYGGNAMTEAAASPADTGTGEIPTAGIDGTSAWILGSSVPTGAQTVAFTGTGLTSVIAAAYTLTSDEDCEELDSGVVESATQANPEVTLTFGGREGFAAIGFTSGQDAVANITPRTDWTGDQEVDPGTLTLGNYSYDTIGTADVTAGFDQGADDVQMVAVAVAEIVTGTAVSKIIQQH